MSRSLIAPAAADNLWEILFHFVKDDFPDRPIFDAFREFVSPPPPLFNFTRIAGNFIHVAGQLSAMISLNTHQPSYAAHLNAWVKLCRIITSKAEQIELQIQGFIAIGNTDASPPYLGYYESHCLGVALWCSYPETSLSRNYHILQAMLCHVVNEAKIRAFHDQLNLDSQLSSGCLTVRKLASPTNSDLLSLLPAEPCSFTDYRKRIEALTSDSKEILYPLHHLVEIALKISNVSSRHSGPRNYTDKRRDTITDIYKLGEDDAGTPGTTVRITTDVTGDSKTREQCRRALLSNDEFTEPREVITLEVAGKDPSGGLSPGQQYLKAKETQKHIAMANQQLPFAMEQLAPHDIDLFLKELALLSSTAGELNGIDNEDLAAFLAIGFWTSRSMDHIVHATFATSLSAARANIAVLRDTGNSWYFVITPRTPDLRTRIERKAAAQALQPAKRYCLPVPELAIKTICPWVDQISAKYLEVRIFEHNVLKYEAASDQFFKQIRGKHDSRLSVTRIFNHLHNIISRQPGSESTHAMAISGKADILGKVNLHYTATLTAKIQDAYQWAVSDIYGQHRGVPSINQSNQERETNIHVGSRFVPRRPVIAEIIENMREQLAQLRKDMDVSFDRLVNFHNVFTSYTVLMIGFGTGYRAVHDPLLQEAEIDHASGFGVIADKDGNDFYNSRIVWLPPMCLSQLSLYSEHLHNMRRSLFWWNQKLFFSSKEDSITGRQQERSCPGLFYLDQKHDSVEVRPSSLESYLKLIGFALPVNANRHYLRSNLLRMGCPPEVINAFMGHWCLGLEPWGRFSGLSPDTYRRELSKHLGELIKEDKWHVEPGC